MKIKNITEEEILFNDGTVVTYNHDQDCCENVYADFNALKDTDIFDKEFKDVKIEGVNGSGIKMNGYFIPCYNEQNGYYSSNLEIVIKSLGKDKKVIDISEFVEDKID